MKLVAILLFDDVEELDFVGPFEVFGVTGRLQPDTVRAVTFNAAGDKVKGRYGLTVSPDHSFENLPPFDILVVPGGRGVSGEMKKPNTLAFVREASLNCELVTSVCTGALILAAAGLLDRKKATTHWASLDELRQFPAVEVINDRRYVHDGRVITSAGISAGIDMALYVVETIFGSDLKKQVAHRMEYEPVFQQPS